METAGSGLFISGLLHEGDETIALLSPDEPEFWPLFKESPEWQGGAPDPIDRWSRRVIGALAQDWGGEALFPFGGPPWMPFQDWALRSGRAWRSPVVMLVHDRMGLFASWRGAVRLPGRLPLPAAATPVCDGCARPCLHACPAGAISENRYDTDTCRDWLSKPEGKDCLSSGCRVRRACPASESCGRLSEQSAWHMRHFLT